MNILIGNNAKLLTEYFNFMVNYEPGKFVLH
jgi:hypothetical protein